eukprot:scaffold277722_cov55-Attheya_sp.AAC.1
MEHEEPASNEPIDFQIYEIGSAKNYRLDTLSSCITYAVLLAIGEINVIYILAGPANARIDKPATATVTIILGVGAGALPLEGPFFPLLPMPMPVPMPMSTREQKKQKSRGNRDQKREARQLGTSVGGATADPDHRGHVLVLVKNIGGRSVHVHVHVHVHVDCSFMKSAKRLF